MNTIRRPGWQLRDWAINDAEPEALRKLAVEHVSGHLSEAAKAAGAADISREEFVSRAAAAWETLA